MSCNRSTSPLSNLSNSLFNLSCFDSDSSPGSSVTAELRVELGGLVAGMGCFAAAFVPTQIGTEFERVFDLEELRSSLAIVKTKGKSVNVVNTTVQRNQNAEKIMVSKIQE